MALLGRGSISGVGKVSAGKQKAIAATAPTNSPQQPWQAPAYVPPTYAPPAPAVSYAPPANYGGGGASGGFAAPAPAPQKPRMSESDWLSGDAEFLDQENEYNRALSEFTNRINKKKKNFEDDFGQGREANAQNQTRTLTGLGEDFAARGMAYSGVFDQARTETEDNFKKQLANIETIKNRSVAQADDDLADYKQENTLSRGNAKRNALARFANSQSLM